MPVVNYCQHRANVSNQKSQYNQSQSRLGQAMPRLDKLSLALHPCNCPLKCLMRCLNGLLECPACFKLGRHSLKKGITYSYEPCSLSDHDSSNYHSMRFKSQRILNAYALAKLMGNLK